MAKKFKLELEIDKKDIRKFNKGVETLFKNINVNLMSIRSYKSTQSLIQKDLLDNREMIFENMLTYAEAKHKLKSRGLIKHSTPLAVTGQLARDLRFETMQKSPNELLIKLDFANIPRQRPTTGSIMRAAKTGGNLAEQQTKTSKEVHLILETIRHWPIMDSIYSLHKNRIVRRITTLIDDAFKKTR